MTEETNAIETGNDHLSVEQSDDGYVVWATLNRPESHNALSMQIREGLLRTARAIDDSPVRVLVIRGAGGTFCSGGDLDSMGEKTKATDYQQDLSLADLASAFADLSALTVAAVEGYCLAGGLGLASSCDFVVADEEATFGTPEMNTGLFPMQAMAAIMRVVDTRKGLQMLFTGEPVDAATAEKIGLVTELFESGDFESAVREYVSTLANNNPVAIEMGKRAFYTQRDMDYDAALEYLRDAFAVLVVSDEAREGIQAFRDDRDPAWANR
ncbi:enoyl-CoA hydratase/isomerase family protein [Natrinema halophilum]|uniref:enoyl-CoA hydratase/isomerase family protein n=1 Tax=Natrinema halophilum TaxID=1699371 RepID=UPI001F1D244D|nr:enoyl-CoA hydratase-related protein [Natrinema halophilum]UHQ96317.1 enoyl-CoA hydratase-related protein [Natrinema halophilum]